MKKIILPILLVFSCVLVYGQTINGVVIDEETKQEICFATVYFDKTFVGTVTDNEGKFSLEVQSKTRMPLVVSSIGYYSAILPEYTSDEALIIYLKPKKYEIQEVNVKDKSLVRKRKAYMKLFKSQFLGQTQNAGQCKILNEKDISFNYKSASDTLRAFASKPIKIENRALGYRISYYLDKFEYVRKNQSFCYIGNIIFEEDLAVNSPEKLTYRKKRISAYLGSRMQFIRLLWNNDLEAHGFSVRNKYGEKLKYEKYIFTQACDLSDGEVQNRKFITYKEPLRVFYYSDVSELRLTDSRVYFEEGGYFDIGLFWEGKMADQRIGDKLPYEFRLKKL